MKMSEKLKLAKAMPRLMADLGFVAVPKCEFDQVYTADTEWGCPVKVTAYLAVTPWLACKFERESLYSPWRRDDPRNHLFADIPGANPFTGKLNCHPGTIPATEADDMLFMFDYHLTNNVRPVRAAASQPPSFGGGLNVVTTPLRVSF